MQQGFKFKDSFIFSKKFIHHIFGISADSSFTDFQYELDNCPGKPSRTKEIDVDDLKMTGKMAK